MKTENLSELQEKFIADFIKEEKSNDGNPFRSIEAWTIPNYIGKYIAVPNEGSGVSWENVETYGNPDDGYVCYLADYDSGIIYYYTF